MKYLFLILLFPLALKAQVAIPITTQTPIEIITSQFKHDIPSLGAIFIAGMADGLNQTISFHYASFKHVFPKAKDQYWNPAISWMNKYKYNDPTQGPKYLGSTKFLVFTTDGYHMTRFVENMFIGTAIVLRVNLYEKKKWYYYVIEGAGYWLVNRVGFVAVYDGLQIK